MKTLKIGELTARIPVIQGGMGVGISLSGLAGSVAACGGGKRKMEESMLFIILQEIHWGRVPTWTISRKMQR